MGLFENLDHFQILEQGSIIFFIHGTKIWCKVPHTIQGVGNTWMKVTEKSPPSQGYILMMVGEMGLTNYYIEEWFVEWSGKKSKQGKKIRAVGANWKENHHSNSFVGLHNDIRVSSEIFLKQQNKSNSQNETEDPTTSFSLFSTSNHISWIVLIFPVKKERSSQYDILSAHFTSR